MAVGLEKNKLKGLVYLASLMESFGKKVLRWIMQVFDVTVFSPFFPFLI